MKLISINIEKSKHLDKLQVFLQHEQPDVICLQELDEHDIPFFTAVTGLLCVFTPMCTFEDDGSVQGIGIFAKEIPERESHNIGGFVGDAVPAYVAKSVLQRYNSTTFQLLVARIKVDSLEYTIGTTHFPVTTQGQWAEFQQETLVSLQHAAAQYDELIVCGDFNAPRGGEIFSQLSEMYTDNIPKKYVTSIDQNIHRAGYLPLMVDGLFSTHHYQVDNVELKGGISDHLAIVSRVKKV